MSPIKLVAIDLAKSTFHLHIMRQDTKVPERKKLNRSKLKLFMQGIPPCTIAMEACGGSHYWARTFIGFGHQVRLIAPKFVKPFVKSNKNDWADAEAISEAAIRPTMRFVAVKDEWQQDIEAIHRRRERLMHNRIALSNSLRGLLHERGILIPSGSANFLKKVGLLIGEYESNLSKIMLDEIMATQAELSFIESQISEINAKYDYSTYLMVNPRFLLTLA